jgi:hypothetical protein
MLACPDITSRSEDFENKLGEFVETIRHLRKEYLEETVEQTYPDIDALFKVWGKHDRNPIPDFPPGKFILMANNEVAFRELQMDEIIKYRQMIEAATQHKEAWKEFNRLIDGRGEPLFSEARQILLGRRPDSS